METLANDITFNTVGAQHNSVNDSKAKGSDTEVNGVQDVSAGDERDDQGRGLSTALDVSIKRESWMLTLDVTAVKRMHYSIMVSSSQSRPFQLGHAYYYVDCIKVRF